MNIPPAEVAEWIKSVHEEEEADISMTGVQTQVSTCSESFNEKITIFVIVYPSHFR